NVALAVFDIDVAVHRLTTAFGWELTAPITEQSGMKVKTAFLRAGDTTIELMSPLPGETVLKRFLDTRGEGLYRLAFRSGDLDPLLGRMTESEIGFSDFSAAAGATAGRRIVFTHPRSMHGLLLELVEQQS